MQNPTEIHTIKQSDPVWKRLRIERIVSALWLVLVLTYTPFAIYRQSSSAFLTLIVALGFISRIVNHFRWERYWLRIGQRRMAAIHNPQPILAANQPAPGKDTLQFPVVIHLRWPQALTDIFGGLFLLLLLGVCVTLVLAFILQGQLSTIFFIICVVLLIFLILLVLSYFFSYRYQPQTIELTEEGIKTRYMRQERFLRWDEVSSFATYGAQGIKKTILVQTYELANQNTVVRWSQQTLTSLLRAESSETDKKDWNRLIGRINSVVVARTGLPLLNFGDDTQTKWATTPQAREQITPPVEQAKRSVESSEVVALAQNDPLVQQLQFRGEAGRALIFCAVFAIVIIIFGLFEKLSGSRLHFDTFVDSFANSFLFLGSFLLLILLLAIGLRAITQRYWARIGQSRQVAQRYPERLREQVQPLAHAELPQPGGVNIRTKPIVLWLILIIESAIVSLLFSLLFFHWSLWITVVGSLLFALLTSSLCLPIISKANGQHTEVTPEGITIHAGNIDRYISWQDARLFSTYRGLRLLNWNPGPQNYELASEQTVVRWSQFRRRRRMLTIEPAMSPEQYQNWLEQLAGYVVERTGLELMNLDNTKE